jgi:hypothetical protein
MKMDKDFLLHGNRARVGKKAKEELSSYSTNTTVAPRGEKVDAEFAKEQVDSNEL